MVTNRDRNDYSDHRNNNPNTTWKLISIIGIPLSIPITAIITWAFAAGGIVNDVKSTQKDILDIKTQIVSADNRIRALELGFARIEVQYKQILDNLSEIKTSIKGSN